MRIFKPYSRSAFVRSGADVGREGLACSLHSNSSQRCSIGLRLPARSSQSSSSTPNLHIHVFMDLALCTVRCHFGTGKGHPQTIPTKLGILHQTLCIVLGNVAESELWSLSPWRPSMAPSCEHAQCVDAAAWP